MADNDLGRLKTEQWDELQNMTDRLEEAWQHAAAAGQEVQLHGFLPPPDDPVRRVALEELVKTDLQIRCRARRFRPLEDYYAQFPELGEARSAPAALVFEEYYARHLYFDQPPLDGYRERFPDSFEALKQIAGQRPLPAATVSKPAPDTPGTLAP